MRGCLSGSRGNDTLQSHFRCISLTWNALVLQHIPADNAQEKPEWEIDGFSGPFKTIFIGAAHSRMTHVLQRDPNTIVKYSFQSTGRRFSEVDILNKIHKFGPVPGVVQYSPEGSKDVCSAFGEPIHTPGELKNDQLPKHMTKTQLQLLSSGREFENCKDVRQALMICYDILEGSCSYFETKHILKDHLVHKYLVKHRGVLHRDISPKNIYGDPCWKYDTKDTIKDGSWPKFIKELLDYKKPNNQR